MAFSLIFKTILIASFLDSSLLLKNIFLFFNLLLLFKLGFEKFCDNNVFGLFLLLYLSCSLSNCLLSKLNASSCLWFVDINWFNFSSFSFKLFCNFINSSLFSWFSPNDSLIFCSKSNSFSNCSICAKYSSFVFIITSIKIIIYIWIWKTLR
jgi:hypothetical protein